MTTPSVFFSLFYVVFTLCIVFPPPEFQSAGLTLEAIFQKWLGSESEFFVQYHVRRTGMNLLVHSMVPIGKNFFSWEFFDVFAAALNLTPLSFLIFRLHFRARIHQNVQLCGCAKSAFANLEYILENLCHYCQSSATGCLYIHFHLVSKFSEKPPDCS